MGNPLKKVQKHWLVVSYIQVEKEKKTQLLYEEYLDAKIKDEGRWKVIKTKKANVIHKPFYLQSHKHL